MEKKKESPLVSLLVSIVIPAIILSKFSTEEYLGILPGFLVALSLPIAYAIYNLLVRKETGIEAVAPYSGDVYDLESGLCIQQGTHKLAVKKKQTKAQGVFARLVAAGERLMAVIQKCEGMANKDLAKFADQINSLCDKWDR